MCFNYLFDFENIICAAKAQKGRAGITKHTTNSIELIVWEKNGSLGRIKVSENFGSLRII